MHFNIRGGETLEGAPCSAALHNLQESTPPATCGFRPELSQIHSDLPSLALRIPTAHQLDTGNAERDPVLRRLRKTADSPSSSLF